MTVDLKDAAASLRRVFGDVKVRCAGRGTPRFVMQAAVLAGMSSARWSFTGSVGATRFDDESVPVLLSGLVLSGTARLWSSVSGEEVDTTRPFLCPDVVDSELDQPDFVNLALNGSAMDARARADTGVDDFRVRFTGTAPIDPRMDRIWRDTMAYAQRMSVALVDHPDAAIVQTLQLDGTAALMLRTFPNTMLDVLSQQPTRTPRAGSMRRALQFIEDNLAMPINVADIARAAGLSTRGLHAGFQRDLQVSPMAYLRMARLRAARDELRGSDPAATTVEAVAMRWGFPNPSRFRKQYLATYEEDPGQTLEN